MTESTHRDDCHSLMRSLLWVRVQSIDCCIDLTYVDRVVSLVALQAVPGAPIYFAGLLNLSGRNIPVIDLGLRLGMERPEPYTADTPIIVCTAGADMLGVIVNDVNGMEWVHSSDLQLGSMMGEGNPLLNASINTDRGMALLLDIDSVITSGVSADLHSSVHHPYLSV